MASGVADQRDQRPRPVAARATPMDSADAHQGDSSRAARPVCRPRRTARVFLPDVRVGLDVAQVVGLQAAPPPAARRARPPRARTTSRRGRRRGVRPARPGTARAARRPSRRSPPARRRRRRRARRIRGSRRAADHPCRPSPRGRTRRPSGMNHQVTRAARLRPASPATPKAMSAAILTCRTVASLPGHEADRADPVLVGAPHPVGVVVDVVRADLDAQRHDQAPGWR